MKSTFLCLVIVATLILAGPSVVTAFDKGGCGGADCRSCHTLTREQASQILSGWVDNVLNVEISPVPGLWVVDIEKGGKKVPIYIHFSKNFIVSGQVVNLATREEITGARLMKLNERQVDISTIPLTDSLVMGKPSARKKVVVLSDPDCHFCAKLHEAIKTVLAKDPDVAFYIKLYSRNNSPATIEKAKSVYCANSTKLLDDAYAGKGLPPAKCQTGAVDEARRLADKLAVTGTPTLVLPDGRIVNGYRDAETLEKLIKEGTAAGGATGASKK